jgi:arylsulfatase A-like enzyme
MSVRVLILAAVVTLTGCAQPPPRGVVLIVIDTLRADHLGVYGYDRPTSAHLDTWAQSGVVFERTLATSPWTLPTFGSILTGQLPSQHGAGQRLRQTKWKSSQKLSEDLPTLAGLLTAADIETGAIVTNPWLRPRFGVARGFQDYDYSFNGYRGHRRADTVKDLALEWIEERGERPFFLLLHILDPHMTYNAPAPDRGLFTGDFEADPELPLKKPKEIRRRRDSLTPTERSYLEAAYDEEVVFVDRQLGELFEALSEMGLWQELLILLTSDHGEEFFDHQGFEHGHSVYQELLHVPLIVWGPGIEPRRESGPVSVIDIAPTILDAMAIEPSVPLSGISLWPNLLRRRGLPSRALVAEGTLYGPERQAIVRWPFKLTKSKRTGRARLFNLEDDPAEKTDLAESDPRTASRLLEELDRILQEARQDTEADLVLLDEKTAEELRSLGYID